MAVEPMKLWGFAAALKAAQAKDDSSAGGSAQGGPQLPSDISDASLQLVRACVAAAAEKAGFPLQNAGSGGSGRMRNVVLAMHSAAGPAMGDLAYKHTGGLVLLGSTWSSDILFRLDSAGGFLAGSRPMMMLGGELDGQMPWTTALPYAAQSAWVAARQGAEYAAAYKPFILVPGVNHAITSGAVPLLARGDALPAVDKATAVADAGAVLAAFMTAHWPSNDQGEASTAAVAVLQKHCKQTFGMIAPYAQAMGAGNLAAAWSVGEKLDKATASEGMQASSTGTGMAAPTMGTAAAAKLHGVLAPPHKLMYNVGCMDADGSVVQGMGAAMPMLQGLPPSTVGSGVVAVSSSTAVAMEAEVEGIQLMVAHRAVDADLLPNSALRRMRLVVSLHPTLDGFLYSQPTVRKVAGGRAEVHVHAYLHWPVKDRGASSQVPTGLYPFSPDLWVKLKGVKGLATQVRAALGLPPLSAQQAASTGGSSGGSSSSSSSGAQAHELSAADINRAALDWALREVSPQARARYEDSGVPLVVDKDTPATGPPIDWVQKSRMAWKVYRPEQPEEASVAVSSPVVQAAALPPGASSLPEDPEACRFLGGLYVKVLSRAMAVEWILLGSLRQRAILQETAAKAAGVDTGATAGGAVNTLSSNAGTICYWGGHVPAANSK